MILKMRCQRRQQPKCTERCAVDPKAPHNWLCKWPNSRVANFHRLYKEDVNRIPDRLRLELLPRRHGLIYVPSPTWAILLMPWISCYNHETSWRSRKKICFWPPEWTTTTQWIAPPRCPDHAPSVILNWLLSDTVEHPITVHLVVDWVRLMSKFWAQIF